MKFSIINFASFSITKAYLIDCDKSVDLPLFDTLSISEKEVFKELTLIDNNERFVAFRNDAYFEINSLITDNYENDEFVVLNIPIDKGWTLTCDNEEIEMYKSNGGFIGFIARSGLHHYKLNYVTPSLMLGVGISIGSSFIFFILTFSSFYVVEIKEKKLKIKKREIK